MQCHTLKPLFYSTANPVGKVEVQPVEKTWLEQITAFKSVAGGSL